MARIENRDRSQNRRGRVIVALATFLVYGVLALAGIWGTVEIVFWTYAFLTQ